jgi:hypothetical protein
MPRIVFTFCSPREILPLKTMTGRVVDGGGGGDPRTLSSPPQKRGKVTVVRKDRK